MRGPRPHAGMLEPLDQASDGPVHFTGQRNTDCANDRPRPPPPNRNVGDSGTVREGQLWL